MSRTAEQMSSDYTAMGHSVFVIDQIVSGNHDDEMTAIDRQNAVDQSVEHLELMVALSDWGSEDMTASNAAIISGNGYTAS